jgi:integrase
LKREQAKALLAGGSDPSHAKKRAKLIAAIGGDTFEEVANEYLEKLERERKATATLEKTRWLIGLAVPELGSRSVKSIPPIDVLSVLRSVERKGKFETADRLRSLIGAVFRYAVATQRAEVDPTGPLRGALTTPKVIPRPAIIDRAGFGALLRAILLAPQCAYPVKGERVGVSFPVSANDVEIE